MHKWLLKILYYLFSHLKLIQYKHELKGNSFSHAQLFVWRFPLKKASFIEEIREWICKWNIYYQLTHCFPSNQINLVLLKHSGLAKKKKGIKILHQGDVDILQRVPFCCLFRHANHFTDHEAINFTFTQLEGQNKHHITPSALFRFWWVFWIVNTDMCHDVQTKYLTIIVITFWVIFALHKSNSHLSRRHPRFKLFHCNLLLSLS